MFCLGPISLNYWGKTNTQYLMRPCSVWAPGVVPSDSCGDSLLSRGLFSLTNMLICPQMSIWGHLLQISSVLSPCKSFFSNALLCKFQPSFKSHYFNCHWPVSRIDIHIECGWKRKCISLIGEILNCFYTVNPLAILWNLWLLLRIMFPNIQSKI